MPGREVARPGVDRDDGAIERETGRHVPSEAALLVVTRLAGTAQARQPDEALGVGRAAGPDAARRIMQLDVDSRLGNPVLDPGDPHDALFVSDARGNAEVCRL